MTSVLLLDRVDEGVALDEPLEELGRLDTAPLPGQMHLWRKPGRGDDEVRDDEAATAVVARDLTPKPPVPSLEQLIGLRWSQLQGAEAVSCPACGGVMHPAAADGAEPVEGYCADCGASMS